ncbi:HK97 family phage prohead protease [Ancylobacter sp. Lp-2]|uniref:HK97 family phage prohead protease n=1 Tax=Ancylobacter sp. Lp-2 TaxID=2881339 RepID=UPI001E429C72|nr:HK97 family phage prohead protease [Ancylobacter sp. Lp-2]MCB4771800.1 HK97 family phage prohead protease [Ancylobacter sp. Lp-2]
MDEGLSATGRRMVGYALRWGHPAQVTVGGQRVTETFRRGAFLTSIAEGRVLMCLDHMWDAVVARQADGTLTLVEDAVGLRVDAVANHSPAGDDALEAVRCRACAGLSVSFDRPAAEWRDVDGESVREIVSCELLEVSVCRNPAYRSSEIVAGRMRIDAFLTAAAALDDPHGARLARLEAAEAALRR